MVDQSDRHDKREARTLAILITILLLVLVAMALWVTPIAMELTAEHLSPGMGLKDSAIIALFATIIIMIVFALAAGDGLLGEVQFMLGGFFSFFVILWLLIAWIF